MPYEYEFMGKKVTLEPDEDLVAVRFAEPAKHSTRAASSAAAGLGPFGDRIELPGESYTIIPVAQTAASRGARRSSAVKSLNADNSVKRVAPVFNVGENKVVATDRVLVGFADKASKHKDLLKKLKCEVVEERDKECLVRLPEDADPFEVSKKLSAMSEVEYAEPDFVTIGEHIRQQSRKPGLAAARKRRGSGTDAGAGAAGGDPMLPLQYAATITKAVDAWGLQVGDPAVKIAILDEGVDTDHEDLKAAIAGTYDATDDDSFQEPNPWDGHGTACAGLAAAIPGNNKGIRGIGGGCGVLAIRIAYSEAEGKPWKTSNSIIARAIDWAWKNGASVLSNSWGGGLPSNAIVLAFERARTQGRNGKGCAIIIAAGNDAGPVEFPANLANVLAVSASNEFDQFKTKTSRDGEFWWGSCFGPQIGVAAPGVHNHTTDISGDGGYNPGDPSYPDVNYVSNFNGTSSATPIVAGAAGLVLSADPNLTEKEVRDIITGTADKVGSLPYIGGRNDQFGYGRLNVLEAVRKAQAGVGASVPLQGNIVQLDGGHGAGVAAFALRDGQGKSYLLRRYTGEEGGAWSVLEAQNLAYLGPLVGNQRRTVDYVRKQETPAGAILWGVSVS